MKKTLFILCALVCGTLAFAQTDGTYTGNLHVEVSGSESDVKDSQVTVVWDEDDTSQLDFTLHNFAISIGSTDLTLGDITIKQVDVDTANEKDGVATFSCTEDHEVELDGTVSLLVSSISVDMTGTISDDELYASMTIDVTVLLVGSYNITATFATSNYGLNGDYLIVNVESGYYLAGGLGWGTCAMEGGKPQFMTLEAQADGTYTIDSHQTNGGNYHYLGTNRYMDNLAIGWTIEEMSGGYTLYYNGTSDNVTFTGYLTGAGFQEQVVASTTATDKSVWKLVSRDDIIADMANATVSQPVDVSALIPSCEPKRNAWGDVVSTGVWTATGYNVAAVPANYSFGQDGNVASVCESYHSTNGFDIRQTISSLPVGYYELTAQAFYRNDGGTVIPSMYITTGTSATDTSGSFENVHLPEHNTTSDGMTTAYPEFLEEKYPVSLPFIVDAEGETFTIGFESNTTGDDAMWTIFGELGLLYMGTELPDLTAVTGTMNVDVEAAMTAAIAAYEANKTSANYIAAEQAIFDAEESVAYYAEIAVAIESTEYEEVLETFDDAGQAAFQTDFLDAYTNRTLTNETVEDGLVAACKAQTTAGSDMSYALLNSGEWTAAQGNGPNAYSTGTETYCDPAYTAQATTGKVLYKTIEGLQAGTYIVSFYAASNLCNGITGASGADLTVVYANDVTGALTVGTASSITLGESYLYTLECTVDEDGKLEFGIENIASTCGNWYVCQAISLTLVELAENPYDYDVTWKLANPSFEVDNVVENLTADGGRGYSVTTLTGWDLSSSGVDHCDLMTKEATETDNNLGVPGEAADGDYWLYLKKTWGSTAGSASVKQKVTLPAGDYKLTVQSMAVAASATAKLVAGKASKSITINGTSAGSENSHPIAELTEWTTNELVFTVDTEEGTEVELGVDFTFPTGAGVGSILIDNFKLYSVEEITEEISWTMTDAGWGTMILPFSATLEDGLTAYSCDGTTTDEETETTTVNLAEVGQSITANTPYIIKCTDDSAIKAHSFTGTPTNTADTYTTGMLTGTLVDLAVAKGAAFATDGTQYLLQNHDGAGEEGLAFYPIIAESSSEATLDAYHCYLTLDSSTSGGSGVRASISLPGSGEETGIVAVESAEAEGNGAIYDLSGRKVSKAVKGVYIQNGKKVLVK